MKLLNLCVLTFTVTALTASVLKAQQDFSFSRNDIFNANADDVTVLMYYAFNWNSFRGMEVGFLIDLNGRDYVTAVDSHGQTALMYAIAGESPMWGSNMIYYLFRYGKRVGIVDARNNLGQTIDMYIVSTAFYYAKNLFFNNIDARDYLGRTLLMYICERLLEQSLSSLLSVLSLDYDLDYLNARDHSGQTALAYLTNYSIPHPLRFGDERFLRVLERKHRMIRALKDRGATM